MKFSIDKKKIINALSNVIKALPTRGMRPEQECILINAKKNKIMLTCSSFNFTVKIVVEDVDIKTEGSICIPGKKLYSIISTANSDTIHFDLTDCIMQIKYGKSKFNISCLNADGFPKTVLVPPELNYIKTPKDDFITAINMSSMSVESSSNQAISNIFMEIDNNNLNITSCNGTGMSLIKNKILNNVSAGNKSAILPLHFILNVIKILSTTDEETIDIAIMYSDVIITHKNLFIIFNIAEGKFPNLNEILNLNFEKYIKTKTLELISSLERASSIISESNQFNFIKLTLNENILKIEIKIEQEMFEDSIDIDYTGEIIYMCFNLKYLLKILKSLPSKEINLNFNCNSGTFMCITDNNNLFKSVLTQCNIF